MYILTEVKNHNFVHCLCANVWVYLQNTYSAYLSYYMNQSKLSYILCFWAKIKVMFFYMYLTINAKQ